MQATATAFQTQNAEFQQAFESQAAMCQQVIQTQYDVHQREMHGYQSRQRELESQVRELGKK